MRICTGFQNGLGNWVLFTSALKALKMLYPDATLDVVFDGRWKDNRSDAVIEMCKKWPLVDNVRFFPCSLDGYDLFFITQWGGGAIHEALLSLTTLPQRPPRWESGEHEVEYYMSYVYGLGYKGGIPTPYIPLAQGPILPKMGTNVCLCNGSVNRPVWQKKKWPYFPQLARALVKEYDARVVWVGGEEEWLEGQMVMEACGGRGVNYAGRLTISETAKVISQCDLAVMNDSGLMHVADALGIPLITLFGPTLITKNRPFFTKKGIVLGSSLPCAPCQGKDLFFSCSDYECMRGIKVERVMKAVERVLCCK